MASMAKPPMEASSKVKRWPYRWATAWSTFTPSATTSGPIPSPGSVTILACMNCP